MGASAREIEQQIKETRARMDQDLSVLENRAASGAVRYGTIAAIVVVAAAAAVAGFLIYRRVRRRTLKHRLQTLSPDTLRELADELTSRMKKPLPTVRVSVSEKGQDPGTFESILRKVAPAVVATGSTALVKRLAARRTAPQAD
jgi:hypothetical protein